MHCECLVDRNFNLKATMRVDSDAGTMFHPRSMQGGDSDAPLAVGTVAFNPRPRAGGQRGGELEKLQGMVVFNPRPRAGGRRARRIR